MSHGGSGSLLDQLSPEIQHQILSQSDDLAALYAIIRASPRLYQVFRLNKEDILSTVALCQFHPAVQPEAVAIAKLAQLRHQFTQFTRNKQSRRDVAVSFCDSLPDQIYKWCDTNASGLISTNLCKLDRVVKFFIKDYARYSLPILRQLGQFHDLPISSEYPPDKPVLSPHLSRTEIGRLQRAFCRFEIYRLLFARCSQDVNHDAHECCRNPPLITAEQAKAFFQHFPAYQIEEVASIRDYILRRLRGISDELDNEAVRTLPVEIMTFKKFDESAMWASPFYQFTTHAQHQREDHLEHLMSLGLPYIRQTLEASGDEQRSLFLHHVPGFVVGHSERHFLSNALRCMGQNPNFDPNDYPRPDMKKDFAPACDENGFSEVPQGWLWGHCHLEPYRFADSHFKGLRDWGYVFWDYNRLERSGILRRDPDKVRRIYFSDSNDRYRPSVEQRLHDLHPSSNESDHDSDGWDSDTLLEESIAWDDLP